MLTFLRKVLAGGPYYIRLRADLLTVRDIDSKNTVEDAPILAISKAKQPSILAIGANASSEALKQGEAFELVNGFKHPRSILSDFTSAEKTLQYFIRKTSKPGIFRPSPIVILHPLEKLEGGLTGIEVRALQELAIGAGAREAYVWVGQELTDEEIERREFPGDHWLPAQPKWAKNKYTAR